MASLTVRQLDDKLKRRLRLRAARNGRSMEDEVRTILRQASVQASHAASIGDDAPKGARSALRAPRHHDAAVPLMSDNAPRVMSDNAQQDRSRVLLIIGGGIAAYKS